MILENIVQSFSEVGVDVDEKTAAKCAELCSYYDLSANDIVDQWLAFSISNEDIPISIEQLNLMEKKVLSKISNITNCNMKEKSPIIENIAFGSELMDMDVQNYSQSNSRNNEITPIASKSREARLKFNSPRVLFSPASFSPTTCTSSKKYVDRSNSGDVICRFGTNSDSNSWTTTSYRPQLVKIDDEFLSVPVNVRYMFESISDRVQTWRKLADSVCTQIAESNNIKLSTETNQISMETTTYAGRIICDSNGKLNTSSILLESCFVSKRCRNTKLQVNDIKEYSLFPGQMVVLEGKNPVGEKIIAEKIYSDVILPMCPAPKEFLEPREPLEILISAGPYTLSDTLSYQPLFDLRDYILDHKPHVLILLGPIVDSFHPNISDNSTNIKFIDLFFDLLTDLLNHINEKKIHTEVVVISSGREAGQKNIYPTPPTSPKNCTFPNVHFYPDPCIVNISGFSIGMTTTDILMHLGKEELFYSSSGPGLDRLGRLASHILQQRSFYPLVPAAEEMTIDLTLTSDYAQLPHIPHMLILPSDLRYFIKNIKGCIVINPERLTKGLIGGNFARVQVRAATENEVWTAETHLSAQIVKI